MSTAEDINERWRDVARAAACDIRRVLGVPVSISWHPFRNAVVVAGDDGSLYELWERD